MFINKWLVTESWQQLKPDGQQAGICFSITNEPANLSSLLIELQKNLWNIPFCVLIQENISIPVEKNESFADVMIRLFFQPSYYQENYKPLLFVARKAASITGLLEVISQKCSEQGLNTPKVHQVQNNTPALNSLVTGKNVDLVSIINQWSKTYFEQKDPSEINLLISPGKGQNEIFESILEQEATLISTDDYSIASFLYAKQREIEDCRQKLHLKIISEKSTQLYLSIQKEERANGLKWYHNEYEILPVWYKKFGHIIKVIMGKRSFKSLFSDKVKKYKD
jgi:hypothetical protein